MMAVERRRAVAFRIRSWIDSTQKLSNLLCDRIPSVFEAAHEEAKNSGARAHDDYMERHDYKEPGALEDAESHAIDVYLNLVDENSTLEQAYRNLAAAGMYHLFEQHMALLLELLQGTRPKKIDLNKAYESLAAAGVSVPEVLHNGPIDELRLVANAVKHGDGRSSEELRLRRPEVCESDVFGEMLPIVEPLAGQGIAIGAEQLREYGAAIVRYWTCIADGFDVQAPSGDL